MDYSLLDEHLEAMQPYLIKWFREYNIMLLNSGLKTNKYEVLIDVGLHVKNILCQGHMYSIYNAFQELIRTYYYSMSAYLIEKELRSKGEIGWSNYWKYEVKNYYFRSVIPRFFSILDYIAVMINELSGQKLVKNIRQVYFEKIKSLLLKDGGKDNIGWLTKQDIKEINKILKYVYADITDEEKEILRPFRDKSTHRYLVGIDELTVPIRRKKLTGKEIKLFRAKDDYAYSVKGKPEFGFNELAIIIEKIIDNLDLVVSKLMELDIMKDVVKVR